MMGREKSRWMKCLRLKMRQMVSRMLTKMKMTVTQGN